MGKRSQIITHSIFMYAFVSISPSILFVRSLRFRREPITRHSVTPFLTNVTTAQWHTSPQWHNGSNATMAQHHFTVATLAPESLLKNQSPSTSFGISWERTLHWRHGDPHVPPSPACLQFLWFPNGYFGYLFWSFYFCWLNAREIQLSSAKERREVVRGNGWRGVRIGREVLIRLSDESARKKVDYWTNRSSLHWIDTLTT